MTLRAAPGPPGGRRATALLLAAFAASGVAGVVYEVTWTRYLSLYVGHGAYAQALVLAVYLGGMAVGSLAVARRAEEMRRPLATYAVVEAILAVGGLLFHPVYTATTAWSYEVLFPALPGAGSVGALRWGIAGLLVLPQALLLGATFPLMATGFLRARGDTPGRGVARVYLVNTLGGAAGVLLAGFVLVDAVGLPGTLWVAALLNGAAALGAWAGERATGVGGPTRVAEGRVRSGRESSTYPLPAVPYSLESLRTPLLVTSALTAVASFGYEIAWIRLLSLVLGSATHAFELMLSAFLLGLALGAWMVRGPVDRWPDPLRALAAIQILMGLAALSTLPLYVGSFQAVSWMVQALPSEDGGYALFNLGRYALCLAVMLPATVLAGATLPAVAGTLMRAGGGDRVIGRVYGWNGAGAVVGVLVASLVALPVLGLKGLLAAAAALDIAVGGALLLHAARLRGTRLLPGAAATTGALAVVLTGWAFLPLNPLLLTSGVFRDGALPPPGAEELLFYQDGRTATVSAHLVRQNGLVVLATNGKADASLESRWYRPEVDTLAPEPIEGARDFTTQALAPLTGLAHAADARSAVNVGHGSGLSASSLLSSPVLERLVTLEIEPAMVEGSFVFLPRNRPVFDDPRSTFVLDDARSWLAWREERFDLVFAEPSNPWVSGTAGLFTEEFYRRASSSLATGGIMVQWMQLYEMEDELVLSVLAALDRVFPFYRVYLVGAADVAMVASTQPLPEADWSVLEAPGFRELTAGAPPFRPLHAESLFLFDQSAGRALLEAEAPPVNSDYRPVLDLGAERARFLRRYAQGIRSFASARVDLGRHLAGELRSPLPYHLVPDRGMEPMVAWGRGAWLREALAQGGAVAPEPFPDWTGSLLGLRDLLAEAQAGEAPPSWSEWSRRFLHVEDQLHRGTWGWSDTTFQRITGSFLEEAGAPPEARAVHTLAQGLQTLDWTGAAQAADVLVEPVARGEGWAPHDLLLDVAVLAYLETGQPAAAQGAWETLAPRAERGPTHLRTRLLEALIRQAEEP